MNKSFTERFKALEADLIANLCLIQDTSHILPHTVYIEEEREDGSSEYNKYKLVEIRPDGGCSVIDCNGIRINDHYHLSNINIEWLLTIWGRHSDIFYHKEYKCGEQSITRGELESLPCPFYTADVTDKQMQAIVDDATLETRDRFSLSNVSEIDMENDRQSEVWWAELEKAVCARNIPYYEDLDDNQ